MKFVPTKFGTAWLLQLEPHHDNRGFFARTWCAKEFRERGLDDRLVQCSLSYNQQAGTLRGMHLQITPYQECKLVRCVRGAIFDVIVDCRLDSPTFGMWEGFELNEENRDSLYIPEGFAHGFQTLVDGTEVMYQINQFHQVGYAEAFHPLDPAIGITWPKPISIISVKDQQASTFLNRMSKIHDRQDFIIPSFA